MNNKKELMEINDEFMNLFDEDTPKKSKSKKKSKKSKSKSKSKSKKISKKIKKENFVEKKIIDDNFKDNILVFIEPSEIVDIQKLLNMVDKLKQD